MKKQIRPDSKINISGVHLWLVLWRSGRVLETHARRSVEELGMCRSDFGVLESLLHKGPLPVNVLGAKVLLTSGSITTAVDRLERRGLVERCGDSNDRRARIIHLTQRGRSLIGKAFASHQRAMEHAVSVLDPEERRVLIVLLRKLGRGAEDLLEGHRMSADQSSRRRSKI
ncbi:MAG TPA: MarR family winged helix-turn-helix transcriptional regulator [Terriglobia bacterium]|nr:MarR family winged helix-turn-helix transcriptional regulator [Terriglobia bacterium]